VYTEKTIEMCRPTDTPVTNGHHRFTAESTEQVLEPNLE